jgi:phytoene/squalene synthetase
MLDMINNKLLNMENHLTQTLAADITRSASKQTYYTIKLFVDRDLVEDAYRAYAYFRWVDDVLEEHAGAQAEKIAFVDRQGGLLEACCQDEVPNDLCLEELMLVELVRNDSGENPGLQSYLRNMMAVMKFDAQRRGRNISEAELFEYSRSLATSVTDAMNYFIGHDEPVLQHEARYLAVTAAHITHMLRDTQEDVEAGYFNIPGEYLHKNFITPGDVESSSYQKWVCGRVGLARKYFMEGKPSIAQTKNLRRRLVGYAYSARFEWMLRTIERDNYCLRSGYQNRKSLPAGLWMSWVTLVSMLTSPWNKPESSHLVANPIITSE